jgi:diguanylate cyclase (GGDEF)-like protein
MTERTPQDEIERLNKIIEALMDRAERSETGQGSDFNLFHTDVLLEAQVRRRTEELKAALEENERITRALREYDRKLQELNARLSEQVTRDPLTGLFNRRYLEDSLQRELALAKRQGFAVSVVMGDIDHFKNINDAYGHQAGDEVLKKLAGLLQTNSRESDICCRYGGEEFLLVMPNVPEGLAVQRAESLRMSITEMIVPFSTFRIRLTASFGVATYPKQGLDTDSLIGAADEALYEAKELGRNRVCCNSAMLGRTSLLETELQKK